MEHEQHFFLFVSQMKMVLQRVNLVTYLFCCHSILPATAYRLFMSQAVSPSNRPVLKGQTITDTKKNASTSTLSTPRDPIQCFPTILQLYNTSTTHHIFTSKSIFLELSCVLNIVFRSHAQKMTTLINYLKRHCRYFNYFNQS